MLSKEGAARVVVIGNGCFKAKKGHVAVPRKHCLFCLRTSTSAARAGGSEAVVRRRRAIERRRIVVTLSATLAREEAERVLAYVRDAQLSGRAVDPVSTLLVPAR
jgi:hypothetical protein